MKYSEERREAILGKLLQPHKRTVAEVAEPAKKKPRRSGARERMTGIPGRRAAVALVAEARGAGSPNFRSTE